MVPLWNPHLFTRGLLRVVQTTEIVTILCCRNQGIGTESVKGTADNAVIGNCAEVNPVSVGATLAIAPTRYGGTLRTAFPTVRTNITPAETDFTPAQLPITAIQAVPFTCSVFVPSSRQNRIVTILPSAQPVKAPVVEKDFLKEKLPNPKGSGLSPLGGFWALLSAQKGHLRTPQSSPPVPVIHSTSQKSTIPPYSSFDSRKQ